MKKVFSFLFSLAVVTACSTQSRSSDPGISGDQVLSQLGQFTGQSTASSDGTGVTVSNTPDSTATSQINTMASDATSIVYFAQGLRTANWGSTGPMGSPVTIAAFSDFTAFGLPNISSSSIQDVQAFYIEDQGNAGLLVAINLFSDNSGSYTVSAFTGSSSSSSDGYTATVTGQNGELELSSADVDKDGNLTDTIQLQVSFNGNPIGQFSVMSGFRH